MVSYSDDFNRPDSTTLGPWVKLQGDSSISGNQFAPGTVGGYGLVRYSSSLDTPDHYAEITITNTSSPSNGVFARSDSTGSNFYLWRADGSTWTLFINSSGSFISLGSYAGPLNAGDVARIECRGNVIKGYINGVERVSVVHNGIVSNVYAGLRVATSSTSRLDNFAAGDILPPDSDPGAFFNFL